jgi:hypothetical protein
LEAGICIKVKMLAALVALGGSLALTARRF